MNIIETNLSFDNLTKRSVTNRIILHHTAVTVLQSVEIIHNYHKNTLNYAGIGYHFYVKKDGNIHRGRTEDAVGAHAYGHNSDSIGICFEGNFDVEEMTQEQIATGNELINYLKEKFNIDKVQMHRDVNQTSCPGNNFKFAEIVNRAPVVPESEINVSVIKELQGLLKTVQDGIYGPITQELVNKRRIMKGAVNSNLVRFTQQCLKENGYNIVIDGNFGSQTYNTVIEFQGQNNQVKDGWVGSQTMKKLLKM